VAHEHDNGPALERIVDSGRLDDVLAAVSLQDVAEAWSCYYERKSANGWAAHDDPDLWSIDLWLAIARSSARESVIREGLLALVNAVPEELLAYIGAGPLMEFVEPDEDRIAWIERVAAPSSRFRTALSAVAAEHEEIWVVERLERAAGARLYGSRSTMPR
jgi:hypothetical protein